MPPAPTHRFTFDDEDKARLFVVRLVVNLKHLAIYRDGAVVYVVDEDGRADELARLARMSGGWALTTRPGDGC